MTPAAAVPATTWAAAHDTLVATLRDLIRIPSVNPPPPDAADGETRVARYLADRLTGLGLRPGGRRAGPRSRLGPRPPAWRRDGRRPVPAPVAPRCRARAVGALDPRPVRRGHRRWLRLRPGRGRHEGHDRARARRHRAAGRGGARGRPRSRDRIRSPVSGATCCSPARPTRRPARSTARAGSPSTDRTGYGPPVPSTSAAASR